MSDQTPDPSPALLPPDDEREALAQKIIAEIEHSSRMGGIWLLPSVVRETLKMAEAAGFTRSRNSMPQQSIDPVGETLMPCPFCGCDVLTRAHEGDCYFRFGDAPPIADKNAWARWHHESMRAWNRRTRPSASAPGRWVAAVDYDAMKAAKDNAYAERDRLVAALSKLFPACLARHDAADLAWDDDWRWIVFITLPSGQASWHIHDSELPMFAHLPRSERMLWDGHDTPEKYRRLAALPAPPEADDANPPSPGRRAMSGLFRSDLESIINRHSQENGSNTPDFILAEYLQACLRAFDLAVVARERWYGREMDGPGAVDLPEPGTTKGKRGKK